MVLAAFSPRPDSDRDPHSGQETPPPVSAVRAIGKDNDKVKLLGKNIEKSIQETAYIDTTAGEFAHALKQYGLRNSADMLLSGENPRGRDFQANRFAAACSYAPTAAERGGFALYRSQTTGTTTLVIASAPPDSSKAAELTELAAVKGGLEIMADEQKSDGRQTSSKLADAVFGDVKKGAETSKISSEEIDIAAIKLVPHPESSNYELDVSRRGRGTTHVLVLDPDAETFSLPQVRSPLVPEVKEILKLYQQVQAKNKGPDILRKALEHETDREKRAYLSLQAREDYPEGIPQKFEILALAYHYSKKLAPARRKPFLDYVANSLPSEFSGDFAEPSDTEAKLVEIIQRGMEIATAEESKMMVPPHHIVLIANDNFIRQFQLPYAELAQSFWNSFRHNGNNLGKACKELMPKGTKLNSNVILTALQASDSQTPAPRKPALDISPDDLLTQ